MRHIAAGVFQGGCAPAGPALKWRLKILSVRQAQECDRDEQTITQSFGSGRIPEQDTDNAIRSPQEPTPALPAQEPVRDEAAEREAALRQAAQEVSARQQAQAERARDGPGLAR